MTLGLKICCFADPDPDVTLGLYRKKIIKHRTTCIVFLFKVFNYFSSLFKMFILGLLSHLNFKKKFQSRAVRIWIRVRKMLRLDPDSDPDPKVQQVNSDPLH